MVKTDLGSRQRRYGSGKKVTENDLLYICIEIGTGNSDNYDIKQDKNVLEASNDTKDFID